MASHIYGQIRKALKNLNPRDVRAMADRPISVGLMASSNEGFAAMEELLVPASLSRTRRFETARVLHRVGESAPSREFDLVLCEHELLCPPGAFRFDAARPERTIRRIVERREDLSLALARNFLPFRKPVIDRIVRSIAKENATFSAVTALPDIIPSLIELPWAVGEFASDTAFLTMNQVRMAFLLAGASDQDVGYKEQRVQIAGIVAGAFGWRALARELVGKIPFGGGLIPKAAIAYAGTFTVGTGLERFYRIGYGLSREERNQIYERALERGRSIVAEIVDAARVGGRVAAEK
ncbi:MAG: hypothetical protein ACM336_20235 [Acidobacteriota bacterium]